METTQSPPSPLVTKGGTHRFKHLTRAKFRAAAFLSLLVVYVISNQAYSFFGYSFGYEQQQQQEEEDAQLRRRLTSNENEATERGLFSLEDMFQEEADPKWLIALYIIGILYIFLALAIVCDEFFVPALEEMSSKRHLNLSMDIAGATLMAAGGSAPELFTSLIGTFKETDIGFGTIVGSAVFNVLFVIGMCSLLSREVLSLTWWPLFRDSVYYAIGLLTLAMFVGVISVGEVELWESLVLFGMYIGYVIVMAYNERLYKIITKKDLYPKEEEDMDGSMKKKVSFRWPNTFRAGLLTLIENPESWIQKARVGLVAKVAGNVDDVFEQIDENGDGQLSRDELKIMFEKLQSDVSEEELDDIMNELDDDDNNMINKIEFRNWYVKSETHFKDSVRQIFDKYDEDNSGTISSPEFRVLLDEIDQRISPEERLAAVSACFQKSGDQIDFETFYNWYVSSEDFEAQQDHIADDGGEHFCDRFKPPANASCFGYIKYIVLFPLVASMSLTIPDTRRPGFGKYCYLSFFLSILWIGVFSYFMVGWTETVGNTFGIPTFIMGLTFLAAGTSVPDLLSSVIVARMGEGDMAVSSSIGSNIFDILVGLPFPWTLYNIVRPKGTYVMISADGVWLNIMILLGMLLLIIVSIHFQGWRLTKCLGFTMFFFYFLYLLQAIMQWLLSED